MDEPEVFLDIVQVVDQHEVVAPSGRNIDICSRSNPRLAVGHFHGLIQDRRSILLNPLAQFGGDDVNGKIDRRRTGHNLFRRLPRCAQYGKTRETRRVGRRPHSGLGRGVSLFNVDRALNVESAVKKGLDVSRNGRRLRENFVSTRIVEVDLNRVRQESADYSDGNRRKDPRRRNHAEPQRLAPPKVREPQQATEKTHAVCVSPAR